MALKYFDWLWHRLLGREYALATALDQNNGDKYTVVLLHGIGSSGAVWGKVAGQLAQESGRVVAFDLLGFGFSPKPRWLRYSTDDHARAVVKSLARMRARKPVILVGHSMGALIAVRVARMRPDLIQHLILYQMPVYRGLPKSRDYKLRRDFYFRLYEWAIGNPGLLLGSTIWAVTLRQAGVLLTPETLQPFVRSLRHTIMEQTTLDDLSNITIPIDIVYGSLDAVVIRGKPKDVFASVMAPLQTHTITQLHTVTPRASKFIAKRIRTALASEEHEGTLVRDR